MPPLQTQFPATFLTRISSSAFEINITAPTITPTLSGSNVITNGGFETAGAGGADVFANWSESVTSTTTINDETSDVYAGSHACRIDVNASNSSAQIVQAALTAHRWYQFSCFAKTNGGTPRFSIGTNVGLFKPELTTDWTEYVGAQRTITNVAYFYRGLGAANRSIYVDEYQAQEIDFASTHALLGTRTTRTGTYTCHPTVEPNWQAGILVGYADDNNYVLAFMDHQNDAARAKLVKCIGGTQSADLVTEQVTYVAGAELVLTVNGDEYRLFYGNVQLGATQTISDAGLGLAVRAFSTSSGSTAGLVQVRASTFQLEPAAMSVATFNAITATDDDFAVVYLPDTQFYSRDDSVYYEDQTQWIVDNAASLNIEMVLHEGDVVDTTDQTQYDVAVAAHALLQAANIPNLIAPGNHDYEGTNPTARDLTDFLTNFPATYWTAKDWFNGEMYNDVPPNMWVTKTIGSRSYIFISLEYNPREAVLDWLDDVLTAHASKTAIIVEHIYLTAQDLFFTVEGNSLFSRLKEHANVLLVGSGHHVSTTDYVGDRSDWLLNGRRVFAFMCNFQNEPTTGGLGYLRIVKIKPNSNAMLVQTYSPSLDSYLTGADEEFVWVW